MRSAYQITYQVMCEQMPICVYQPVLVPEFFRSVQGFLGIPNENTYIVGIHAYTYIYAVLTGHPGLPSLPAYPGLPGFPYNNSHHDITE